MVENKPYVHFKVINEREIEDYTADYLWATTVESNKGPVFEPTTVTDAQTAEDIFGIDVNAFFENGGRALTIVRVAAESDSSTDGYALSKGSYALTLSEDCDFYQVENLFYGDLLESQYDDDKGCYKIVSGDLEGKPLTSYFGDIKAKSGDDDDDFGYSTTIGEYSNDEEKVLIKNDDDPVQIDPTNLNVNYSGLEETIDKRGVFNNTQVAYVMYVEKNNNNEEIARYYVPVVQEKGEWKPIAKISVEDVNGVQSAKFETGESSKVQGVIPDSAVRYAKMLVKYKIVAGTPIVDFTAKYPGDYGITIGCDTGINDNGYNITISEEGKKTILLKNITSLKKIVSRINDREYNLIVSLTEAGKIVNDLAGTKLYVIPKSGNHIADRLNELKANNYANYATKTNPSLAQPYKYKIAYVIHSLEGGSNGYWDNEEQRIQEGYRQDAHSKGLQLLEEKRISGLFCMYEDEVITAEYIAHGEKMSDGEVCKWRTVLTGAREEDRNIQNLTSTAIAINNQYCLYLGQGLIDDGEYIPPYKATAYVAGLRSKLFYGDAMFGGESKKEIVSAYGKTLKIAPLLEYDDGLIWQPEVYSELNEAGVLTFTNEYGQLSLTDGVTTTQYPDEEDEEGIVSILKYAQNHVYDVCVQHIGKNITQDTQSSLEMQITNVLNNMKTVDNTLIEIQDEGLAAYEVEVRINPRKNQLLGKVYVIIKITPVHALRQIEVEMTVQ